MISSQQNGFTSASLGPLLNLLKPYLSTVIYNKLVAGTALTAAEDAAVVNALFALSCPIQQIPIGQICNLDITTCPHGACDFDPTMTHALFTTGISNALLTAIVGHYVVNDPSVPSGWITTRQVICDLASCSFITNLPALAAAINNYE